jgi:hypothetical protein
MTGYIVGCEAGLDTPDARVVPHHHHNKMANPPSNFADDTNDLCNRLDLQPQEAAERVEIRREKKLGVGSGELPDYAVEGDKHVGREYDRLTGTGYL